MVGGSEPDFSWSQEMLAAPATALARCSKFPGTTICACRYRQRSMPFPGQRRRKRRGRLAFTVMAYPYRLYCRCIFAVQRLVDEHDKSKLGHITRRHGLPDRRTICERLWSGTTIGTGGASRSPRYRTLVNSAPVIELTRGGVWLQPCAKCFKCNPD
jgi:hypothetical protein